MGNVSELKVRMLCPVAKATSLLSHATSDRQPLLNLGILPVTIPSRRRTIPKASCLPVERPALIRPPSPSAPSPESLNPPPSSRTRSISTLSPSLWQSTLASPQKNRRSRMSQRSRCGNKLGQKPSSRGRRRMRGQPRSQNRIWNDIGEQRKKRD